MTSFKIFFFLFISQLALCSNFNWLVEIDCDDDLNFFEIRTLNTYSLSNCMPNDSKCGEYLNLEHYSTIHNNEVYFSVCSIEGREIEYALTPINMSDSAYDLTPHFTINLKIDNRSVIQNLPIYPSPLYDKTLWGLKVSSIRFNANLGSVEIIISDDEHYDQNNNKIKAITSWLWNSNYKSAFDPNWGGKWEPLTESDIWSLDKVYPKQ